MGTCRRRLLLSACFLMCLAPSSGQQIRIDQLTVTKTAERFEVSGRITASGLNPKGQIVEEDSFTIYVDTPNGPDPEWPVLPDGMTIRQPADAETSFVKDKRYLTRREYGGHDVLALTAGGGPARPGCVWRTYGGLTDWAKNAPPEVTCEFKGSIPLQHAGKTVRIRAFLRHVWGGPYAAWSAYSFHHDIAYEGPLFDGIKAGLGGAGAGGGAGGGGAGGGDQPPDTGPEKVSIVTEHKTKEVDLTDGLSFQFSQPGYAEFPGPTVVVSPTGKGQVSAHRVSGDEASFSYELSIDRQDAPMTILTGDEADLSKWKAIDLQSWPTGQTGLTVPLIDLNAQTGVPGGTVPQILWKCTWQVAKDVGAKVFTRDNVLISTGRTIIMFGTPYGFGGSMVFGGGALGLKWFAQRAGAMYDQGKIQRQLVHDYVVNGTRTTVAGSYHKCLVKSHGTILEPAPGQTFYAVREGSFEVSDLQGKPLITVPGGSATWLCGDHQPELRPLGNGTPRAKTCAEFYGRGTTHPPAGTRLLTAAEVNLVDADVYEYNYRNWNRANNGGRPGMRVSANVDGLRQTTGRSYFKFDLDRLGSADSLERVELLLTHYTSGGTKLPAPIRALRVTTPWQEGDGVYHSGQDEPVAPAGQLCWTQQPRFDSSRIWAETRLNRSDQVETVSWDITDLVRGWLRGDFPNHGLVLIGADEKTRYAHNFHSSENPAEETRPRLRITTRRRQLTD